MRKQQSVGVVKRGLMAALVMCAAAGCGDRPPSQQQSLQQARSALAAKQYQAAGIALKSYLQAQPQDAEARLLLASALLESNDFVSAEKELRKALELGISRERVEPMLARALIEQGEFKKLVQEIDAKRVNDVSARAEVLASLGRAYLGIGEQELASQQFVAALKLQPTLPAAMLGAVRILIANGELDAALRSLNDLLARDPQLADGFALRAGMLRERGQLAEAAADYQQVLKLKPDDINARANLVMVLIDQQKIAEAKQQVEQLRKRSPLALASNYLYALLAYRDGNYAEAHKYVEIALTGQARSGLVSGCSDRLSVAGVPAGRVTLATGVASQPVAFRCSKIIDGYLSASWSAKSGGAGPALCLASRPGKRCRLGRLGRGSFLE